MDNNNKNLNELETKEIEIKYEISHKKMENEWANDDIVHNSIRIVLETSLVGGILGLGISGFFITNYVEAIICFLASLPTAVFVSVNAYFIECEQSYFSAWEDLIQALIEKYKICIDMQKLKKDLEDLYLNAGIDVNNLGGKSNVK